MAGDLLKLLNIDVPIVLAPMAGSVRPELCAAVSNAGGLGMLPVWQEDPEAMGERIKSVRALTARPFGVNLNNNYPQDQHLTASIDAGATIASFFWGLDTVRIARAKTA